MQAEDRRLRDGRERSAAIVRTIETFGSVAVAGPHRCAVGALREAEHRARHVEHDLERGGCIFREEKVAAFVTELADEDA
ncbi:MAG TPA: hypothetical protein VGH87_03375 [Polyangiaceae bacterium]